MSIEQVAPVAIVRAAAWPLESVASLVVDDPSLDHDRRVELERRRLWARTAGDPAFMRALSLSNPALAEQVEITYAELDARPRNKRVRHLETTLYRTLARASGRPAPCDLWAGTALARFGERTVIESGSRRMHVAPDLQPFAAMLAALRRRAPDRGRGRWKLNGTVEVIDARARYWHRHDDGHVVRGDLRCPPALARILEVVERRGIATLYGHGRALGELGILPAAARELLFGLAEHGLLVGGVALPTRFRCAWEALEAVAPTLANIHAARWRSAIDDLRALASRVVAWGDRVAPATLRGLQAAARRRVEALAEALGLDTPAIPRAPLRCDVSVPAAITLGPTVRDRIVASIGEYCRFQVQYGVGWDLFRAAVAGLPSRAGVAQARGSSLADVAMPPSYDGAPVWERLLDALGASTRANARARAWTRLLGATDSVEVTATAALQPIGAPISLFSIGLRSAIELDGGFVVRGTIDSVTSPWARHTPLWTAPGDALDPFGLWLADRVREEGTRCGVRPLVLVGPTTGPNTLAQPDLGIATVEPWGTTTDAVALGGARIVLDPASELPWLSRDGRERCAVLAVTSASLGAGDPVSRALLLTGQIGLPVADLPAHTVPFAIELERGRSSPRVVVGDDIVRTRRTVLAGATWTALAGERDAGRRFERWQALAQRHGWPRLVLVRRGGRGLLVPRDCALALAAALEGAAPEPFVVVEDFDDAAWLPGLDGRSCVAELAIGFVRPLHAWCASTEVVS